MSEPEIKFEIDEYGRIGYRVTNEGVLLSKEEKEFIISNILRMQEENAKLRESLRSIQPTDSEGNVLEVADTVHMLRSEYDGDHEWEDVVVELALTHSFGDRWVVRGSKGEAFACECTKTGHDDDAYESSSDVEPLDDATLIEVECRKLREYVTKLEQENIVLTSNNCDLLNDMAPMQEWNDRLRKLVQRMWPVFVREKRATFADRLHVRAEIDELGVEVD